MTNSKYYHRVWVKGQLTTRSALHIGSGDLAKVKAGEDEGGSYSPVCLDVEGQPYLPASSLRGFLAEAAKRVGLDERMQRNLFGEQLRAGCLLVLDAVLRQASAFQSATDVSVDARVKDEAYQPHEATFLNTCVSINPVLGVANAHQLFSVETVPSGAVFEFECVLEQVTHDALVALLSVLQCWDGFTLSALGGGVGKGRGRLEWALSEVRVLEDAHLQAWLTTPNAPLQGIVLEIAEPEAKASEYCFCCEFRLIPQGSFLLNDHAYVTPEKKQKEGEPRLAFSRTPSGQAFIPATALRGWLRARVRRILFALEPVQEAQVDALLEELFGSEQQRGLLWFDDALAEKATEAYLQTFNAVDRFTGGVAEGALYTVEAARCSGLRGRIVCLKDKDKPFPDWAKMLLLFAARDVLEGELSLGWGKGRGFGQFKVELQVSDQGMLQTTAALQQQFASARVKPWWEALTKVLNKP